MFEKYWNKKYSIENYPRINGLYDGYYEKNK
jgi:hypothetical protein